MIKLLIIPVFLLLNCVLMGQTVQYDNGTPQKPISITGLNVNGTLYDVTLNYNIIVDGTTLSGILMGETTAARTAIVDALNSVNDQSEVAIYTVTNEGGLEWCRNAYFQQTDEWILQGCGNTGLGTNPLVAVPIFTEASAIPTLSQWGLFILAISLIIFGIVTVRQREARMV